MRERVASTLENRVRKKLTRWKLSQPPAHITRQALSTFELVSKLCRPCILAMYFRTLWNGWPTTERLKSMTGVTPHNCVFGCPQGLDKIEHYTVCPVTWKFYSSPCPGGLGIRIHLRTLSGFLLLEKKVDEQLMAVMAIGLYAVARTVHGCRHHPGVDPMRLPLLRMHARRGGLPRATK